jgi:hypothetical protein
VLSYLFTEAVKLQTEINSSYILYHYYTAHHFFTYFCELDMSRTIIVHAQEQLASHKTFCYLLKCSQIPETNYGLPYKYVYIFNIFIIMFNV